LFPLSAFRFSSTAFIRVICFIRGQNQPFRFLHFSSTLLLAMNLSSAQIQAIRQHLAVLRPVVVYLFGSAAAGQRRPESDVDLAFLSAQPVASAEVFQAQVRLAEALGSDVDLVDLARATAVLRKEVLATGRVLLETDPHRRAEFEMYALSDYARLNEERAPVLDALGQPLVTHA
jgi:uncharacterized protein